MKRTTKKPIKGVCFSVSKQGLWSYTDTVLEFMSESRHKTFEDALKCYLKCRKIVLGGGR